MEHATTRHTEQQQAAHQAISEITADLGIAFTLEAVADAIAQTARSYSGLTQETPNDNLGQAVSILRNLADVLQ